MESALLWSGRAAVAVVFALAAANWVGWATNSQHYLTRLLGNWNPMYSHTQRLMISTG